MTGKNKNLDTVFRKIKEEAQKQIENAKKTLRMLGKPEKLTSSQKEAPYDRFLAAVTAISIHNIETLIVDGVNALTPSNPCIAINDVFIKKAPNADSNESWSIVFLNKDMNETDFKLTCEVEDLKTFTRKRYTLKKGYAHIFSSTIDQLKFGSTNKCLISRDDFVALKETVQFFDMFRTLVGANNPAMEKIMDVDQIAGNKELLQLDGSLIGENTVQMAKRLMKFLKK